MSRIVLAGVLSGIAMFFWGFVSWIILSWHKNTFHEMPGEERVASVLKEELKSNGAYMIPWVVESAITDAESKRKANEQHDERHRRGPIAQIFFQAEGGEPIPPMTLVRGVVIYIVVGLCGAVLVAQTLAGRPSFGRRVGTVLVAGAFAVVYTHIIDWNFMVRADDYTVVMCADGMIGALIAGLIIAAIVKPITPAVT